jgi:hypothetical protein
MARLLFSLARFVLLPHQQSSLQVPAKPITMVDGFTSGSALFVFVCHRIQCERIAGIIVLYEGDLFQRASAVQGWWRLGR